jgi:hypothetical protein
MRMTTTSLGHPQVSKGSKMVLREQTSVIASSQKTVHNAAAEVDVALEEKPQKV